MLLAGYLLFCHGCHSDEDNELFARRSIPAPDFSLAQVGVEPTASLGLSKGGLPIAYRAGTRTECSVKLDGKYEEKVRCSTRKRGGNLAQRY